MTIDIAPIDSNASADGDPIRWLVIGGLLLIMAIALGAIIIADNSREHALQSSERELENTVLLLARHFDQQFEAFMDIEEDVVAQIDDAGIRSPDTFRGEMATLKWHEMLRSRIGTYDDAAGINIFDANGELINSSVLWPVPDLKIADRNFFKAFKSGAATKPFRTELVQGRFAQGWATVLARKVTAPSGEFLGVVTRAMVPGNFESFFAAVALAPGASIAMHQRDGTLLARYPHAEGMIGRNFRTGGGATQEKVFKLDQYTVRMPSPIDGQDRLIASRALADFPIVMVATTTAAAALADWRRQQAINLDGVFLGTKHSLPLMRESGGGSIINMSSLAGLKGSAGLAGYCATKGGVRLFTKAVAMECAAAKDKVRVNSVHPGIIETPIWGAIAEGMPGEVLSAARSRANAPDLDALSSMIVPIGVKGLPEDIAEGVLYLASDASRYVTGTELVIDGGLSTR